MPSFYVTDTFVLKARSIFVLVGTVVEGTIRSGMFLSIQMNSSFAMSCPIVGVEFVLRAGREDVGLCLKYEDEDELTLLRGLNIKHETLEVSDVEERACDPKQKPN